MKEVAGVRTAAARFVSFDGGVTISSLYTEPDRCRFWDARDRDTRTIARGAGLSYAAASFSSRSVTTDHSSFDRILAFDGTAGLLEVEAGTTLGKIYEFLTPRGFFLAVQPGHPNITVGGCIAADVHGKNQFRDGTFSSQVNRLQLFHPSCGILDLSREHNADLFQLTCGGYGLTGDILSAKLQLAPIPSSSIQLRVTPVPDAGALPELLEAIAGDADLVYSWHDFTASGSRFGRGWITSGSFLANAENQTLRPKPETQSGLSAQTRGSWRASFFSAWTTPVFNRAYATMVRLFGRDGLISPFDFFFPVRDKEVYFKLFGRRGFLEYQVIVPISEYRQFLKVIKNHLARSGAPVTLASAKLFRGTPDLLRFTGKGVCLAMNMPRCAASLQMMPRLDSAARDFGGRPNIIKDSRLPQDVVAATYPEYELFRERLAAFDPKRLQVSELSDRLQL